MLCKMMGRGFYLCQMMNAEIKSKVSVVMKASASNVSSVRL